MIYIAFTIAKDSDPKEINESELGLSREIAEHVLKKGAKQSRSESFYAYRALEILFSKVIGRQMPQVSFIDGRPYINNNIINSDQTDSQNSEKRNTVQGISVSISHSGGVCAAAVSFDEDAATVGIDIELDEDEPKAIRSTTRFLPHLISKKLDKTTRFWLIEDASVKELVLDPEQRDTKNKSCSSLPIGDFVFKIDANNKEKKALSEWTQAEAIIKACGRGFSAIGSLPSLAEESSVASYRFSVGEKRGIVSVALWG